jgi:hypothetical protein
MKKHKIYEYVNDLGDKYFTVSERFMFFFWIDYEKARPTGLDWVVEPVRFDTYEKALEHINKSNSDSFKQKKCTLV